MYHQLTEPERYTLSVLKREGRTFRAIAQTLGRSPSTISREVRRKRSMRQRGARTMCRARLSSMQTVGAAAVAG